MRKKEDFFYNIENGTEEACLLLYLIFQVDDNRNLTN